eukprot:CAMPEP_0170480948 /NCGR_PEP_ID=MMETSP0208-20121228/1582_1 /TAXON_ID=197538 /ORGANISM="Strombidium inclinatum, Strain S3" /LENGTH=88 /DNA_ID=CAMNT_0010753567 /DNA_START=13 /DNA_END=279 /DNA_ORIENTATION=-
METKVTTEENIPDNQLLGFNVGKAPSDPKVTNSTQNVSQMPNQSSSISSSMESADLEFDEDSDSSLSENHDEQKGELGQHGQDWKGKL